MIFGLLKETGHILCTINISDSAQHEGIISKDSYPALSSSPFMSNLKAELEHIKHHIKYPANKTQVVSACNNMSDVPTADKEFVSKSLPESNFKGPEDVVRALLTKV